MNNQYDTLSEATTDLDKKGYTLDFTLHHDYIESKELKKKYAPEDFHVDEFHRFEGISNPDDMAIIFAVTTTHGEKGVIIDAYGTYEDSRTADMIRKLRID